MEPKPKTMESNILEMSIGDSDTINQFALEKKRAEAEAIPINTQGQSTKRIKIANLINKYQAEILEKAWKRTPSRNPNLLQ